MFGGIINKRSTILTKRPPVDTTFSSGTNTIIWALVYRGIPSDLLSRPEQSHHLPGALAALLVTTGNVLSFEWASRPSTLHKRHLFSLFDYIFRLLKKIVIFDEIYHFGCRDSFYTDI